MKIDDQIVEHVLQTDQDGCYDTEGKPIPCAGTGQDGELRIGISAPAPRFDDKGNTVYDRLTGLEWMKDASICEFPLSWMEASDFISEINAGGEYEYSDWRLPGRTELSSLLSYNRINPSLPEGSPFQNVFTGYYWTSTPCARLPHQAWYVHMGGARIFKGMKHGSYMVWPVRDGVPGMFRLPQTGKESRQNAPGNVSLQGETDHDDDRRSGRTRLKERFRINGSTAFDTLTGLIWSVDADCTGKSTTLPGAFQAVSRMNACWYAGFSDWRLPNIRELESLIDTGMHSPALSQPHRFINVRSFYWSSTTSLYDPAYAWVLYLVDGAVGVGFKSHPEFHVWAVRSSNIA